MAFPKLAENGIFGIEIGVFLIVVSDFHEAPDFDGGIFVFDDFFDERGFPRAVVSDDGALFPARKCKGSVFEQDLFSRGEPEVGNFQHLFIGFFGVGKGKAGRRGRQRRSFDAFHFFQLFLAAERGFRGRGAH